MTDLVKELVKLNIQPNEDMIVTFGQQWLVMWNKKHSRVSVDFSRAESPPPPPEISDDEGNNQANNAMG